ncbi:uncharacterized protein LOC110734814 [Chenopodium quinoa]|uniref:uncharacterized protein LOC110734814 n=1 Tax=Chenopodium quinoa TaxID=63459 RepID=UPI000B774BB6|nr:uncharacterized protein LOC110734814 [Chenopodium quinoa]
MKRGGGGRQGNIALKLDMSKAYDQVEWVFLKMVMEKMGFAGEWISRIIACLESVNFSFKINGKISGSVTPTRGLRQGDPISPYLFLLCADAFLTLLNKAATNNLIHGARRASGQKVNLSKTDVTFSKNVDNSRREEIIGILGVTEVEQHEKYLGLPTIIGRSKKVIFAGLKERLWKKLQGWKEKLLSRPGKEILIKAVAQTIPTYMMSIFKIPDTLIDEIHSLLARFWWGSTDSGRKMHWQRWELLCQPKGKGGMGFRDLRYFNQALLAKQLWRLHHNTDTLVHKILKAKYFKSCDVLKSSVGFDPSFAWRSMWSTRSLLLEGMKWRFGNGSEINVWSDTWLPGNTSVWVATPSVDSDLNLRVIDLIDHDSNSWDVEMVNNTFIADERAAVLSTPLSNRCPRDSMYWWPNKSGEYSVQSGYWFGKSGGLLEVDSAWDVVWKLIWSMKAPPKLCHFMWRACKGFLAVRERGSSQLGVVARDERGIILAAAVRKGGEGWLVEVAEATAVVYGLKLARRMGYARVEMESDALNVVNRVNHKTSGCSPFFLVIDDILALSLMFDRFSISHVKRSGNTVAHFVARWDTRNCDEYVCTVYARLFLLNFISLSSIFSICSSTFMKEADFESSLEEPDFESSLEELDLENMLEEAIPE